MALSKRNSRPIVVNGVNYRWAFSAPYDNETGQHRLNLTVQKEEGQGSKLVGTGLCATNCEYLLEPTDIMTPATVARIVSEAVEAGWSNEDTKDWFVSNIEEHFPEQS